MKTRILIAYGLIKLGKAIQSLALMVMRPDDIAAFGRATYSRPENVRNWTKAETIEKGLSPEEKLLVKNLPVKKGKLLLLGIGGGREAVELGRLGFEITGVDFVEDMLVQAELNAAKQGIKIETRAQELTKLNLPKDSHHVIWLSSYMYSSIPTRKKRISFLKNIRSILTNEGYFVCQFLWKKNILIHPGFEKVKRIFAILVFGHIHYELGDQLFGATEFLHAFSEKDHPEKEFEEAGFDVAFSSFSEERMLGSMILKPV